jgi:hypothetical protein
MTDTHKMNKITPKVYVGVYTNMSVVVTLGNHRITGYLVFWLIYKKFYLFVLVVLFALL